MNSLGILNSIVNLVFFLIATFYIIHFVFIKMHRGKKIREYVNLKILVRQFINTIIKIFSSILIVVAIYHSFATSIINLEGIDNEYFAVYDITIFALIIVIVSFYALKVFFNFIENVVVYFKLKKNTVPNNLRHALANKNEYAIIQNYKLLIQTDDRLGISNDEMLVLISCLSKHGLHEEAKRISKPNLYKEKSVISKLLLSDYSFNKVQHKVKGVDNKFKPSQKFNHKLKKYENNSLLISFIIMLAFILQTIVLVYANVFYVPKNITIIIKLVISTGVILLILRKHNKLKEIYINELQNRNVQVSKSTIDKIILALSVCMIVTTFIQFFV